MAFAGTNYLAIVVAALAAMVLDAVYYSIFGRTWWRALGKSESELRRRMRSPWAYLVGALGYLIMAVVLAGAIGHLGPGEVTPRNGVISGAILWAGFLLTSITMTAVFRGDKAVVVAIEVAFWLGVLMLQGLVIGLLGV